MNEAKRDWRRLQQLWPVALAVLAACGGSSDPAETTTSAEDTVAATTEMESAEARRRSSWVTCAAEGATCAVPSTRVVRYGANGTYIYKTVSGSIACNNNTWSDPVVGVAKKCDYAASTTAPTPAPAPSPGPAPSPAPAPAPAPTPAPAPPTSGTADVSWTPSTSGQVVNYRIYSGTAPRTYTQPLGSGFEVGNAASYRITGLTGGKTYYFAVTAIDSSGRESAYSDEKSKVLP